MQKIDSKTWKILLLITIILFTITGCKYSKREKTDFPNQATSTANTTESHDTPLNPMLDSRVETLKIIAPQLGNRQRNIQVYLPPKYDANETRYPVIYLHDGDSLFNPPPERVGDWLIDETLDRLFEEELLQGIIVVGIEFDPENLWGEYIPWVNNDMHRWVKTNNSKPTEGGDGDAYLDFIINTLKLDIDSRYRTLPDRIHTIIGGACRTALIPLYAGLNRPDIFSKVMVMSPSVWLAESGGPWLSNNQLIDYIKKIEVPTNVRIYMDIGTEESSGPPPNVLDKDGERITYPQAYLEGADYLYNTLLSQGVPGANLKFEIFEGAVSSRDEWAKRFDDALIWLMEEIR